MGKKKKSRTIPITVHTMEAELKFHIQEKSTGHELFDMVCRTIGVREHCYFDLEYHDEKGYRFWLKREKKVVDQCNYSSPHDQDIQCYFLVKFYPEDLSEELIQEITQHLFFLQVKQDILSMNIYCPPEASVLLASYAVQSRLGDYDESTFVPGSLQVDEQLLPQAVTDQYQMTPEMWEERIKIWYADHRGLSRDDAEKEYLKIAQDLEMYAVSFFDIKNKKNTDVSLGINALGLHIYKSDNKLTPVISFAWSEIHHISHTDKKFKVKTFDKNHNDDLTFYSPNLRMNNLLFELCEGNHKLYKQRRMPDTLEVQQMKAQAKEEKLRRQQEKAKFIREQNLRLQLQQEKEELEQRFVVLEEENRLTREALTRSEETADLLSQKAELIEEENQLLRQKAAEAEAELGRTKTVVIRTEEEKLNIENRAKEAELLASRILEDSERRTVEMEQLKLQLKRAREEESLAKEKLVALAGNASFPFYQRYGEGFQTTDPVIDYVSSDMNQLKLAMELERNEYMEKSQSLQAQLKTLKSDIEVLKVEDKQSQMDRIHEDNMQKGETKYSTIQKTSAGSAGSRVAFFEEL